MDFQDLTNILTENYYPIAVKVLNNLRIYEVVHLFHAYDKVQNVSIHVLNKRRHERGWDLVDLRRVDIPFLKEFHTQFSWTDISRKPKLPECFIREYQDKVVWSEIAWFQRVSEEFIIEFEDKLDWTTVSIQQTLSEDFIRKHQDKLNWHKVSSFQDLSEDFMREFQLKLHWGAIKKKYQLDLSIRFMMDFQFLMGDLFLEKRKGTKRKIEETE